MTIAIKAFSMSLNWFAEHFSSFKLAIFFLKLKKYLDKRKIFYFISCVKSEHQTARPPPHPLASIWHKLWEDYIYEWPLAHPFLTQTINFVNSSVMRFEELLFSFLKVSQILRYSQHLMIIWTSLLSVPNKQTSRMHQDAREKRNILD